MEWLNAESATLIGVGFASFLAALGVTGRAKKTEADKTSDTAIHQEVVRPVTETDLRQAAAQERIATSLARLAEHSDKIERHLDVMLSRRN